MTTDTAPTLPDRGGGPRLLGTRLSIMMFLQYAVPGVWVPVLGRYLLAPQAEGGLGFSNYELGLVMGLAGTVGALAAPLLVGQIADRWFSTERVMGIMLIAAGVIKYVTAYQTGFWPWLGLSIGYAVVYTPTMMLSNSLAFAHMTDPDRQFPRVRVWGTLGWVVVAWVFPMVWLQTGLGFTWKPPFLVGTEVMGVTARLADALRAGGIVAICYGLYCFTLPSTPPKREATAPLAFLKAFGLFRRPSFAVLMVTGLFLLPIHQVYFMQTGTFLSSIGVRDSDILPAMSLGQIGEIFMMIVLGMMLKRLGFKWVLFIGAMAYFLRYAIFGTPGLPVEVIVASQALHGVCFACYLAAAYIYVDHLAEPDIRHSAQQVFGLVIGGGGPILGGWLNGRLASWFAVPAAEPGAPAGIDYMRFWYVLAAIGLVATVVLAVLFRSEIKDTKSAA